MEKAQTDRMVRVFVYGSLLLDEVVECLIGRTFAAEEAVLFDHARYAIRQEGRVARGPAIIQEPGSRVQGRVLLDVDSETLRLLDRFECGPGPDSRYERVSVRVTPLQGLTMWAETYRAVNTLRPFLGGSWSEQDFKANHLQFYVTEWIPRLRRSWGLS